MSGKPARWLRIVVPVVLILVWLVLAGFGGPTFGKLSGVSSNDQAAFLPASAESTKVQDWQKRFTDSTAIPAIVVVQADEKIPAADLAQYAQLGSRLGEVDGVQPPESGQSSSVAGPIPSEDGRAVEFIVPIADSDEVKTVVADLRGVLKDELPSGTQGWVTGPAGLTADLVNAFGGIDGILLLVAVAAVFVILLLVYRALLLPFLVLLTSVFALCAAILGGGAALASRDAGAPEGTFPTITVSAGESLWTIAEEVAPHRDPRDVVDELVRLNALDTVAVQVGQQLAIPAEYAVGR